MIEKRKYVRSNGLVLVNYKVPESKLSGKSSAFDISGSGVRITLEEKLNVAALVEMEIYLPGSSQPILAKGEVTWAHECKEKAPAQTVDTKKHFYAGIKFTLLDENNKNRIIEYIHRKLH